jgi:beta-xylosidase
MYYTARHSSGRECLSVATSKDPDHGFVDHSTGPLVCQLGLGGSIDPSAFVASDGSAYLLWKSEGEVVGSGAQLWSRKLGDDFTSFDGDAHAIEGVDRAWEGRTIEGPSMAEANGKFYLFYSGNDWQTEDYAEGWAVCEQPIGPCTKPANNVLLKKHDAIAGPGGGEVFMAPGGQLFLSYHAWTQGYVGYLNRRQLHVDRLSFGGGVPQVSSVS